MVWRCSSDEMAAVRSYYDMLEVAKHHMAHDVRGWERALESAQTKDDARLAYTELVKAVRNGLSMDVQISNTRRWLVGNFRMFSAAPVWSTFYTPFGSDVSHFARRKLQPARQTAAAKWHMRLAKDEVESLDKASHRRREAVLRSL